MGRGQVVGANKRISLCGQMSQMSDSDDEGEVPSRDTSTFGSLQSDKQDAGEQPTAACLSDAAASAAGNSFSGQHLQAVQCQPVKESCTILYPVKQLDVTPHRVSMC